MKNKGKFNVILDIILFVVILAIFCIKGQYHELLAYTIGGLAALHLLLHLQQYWAMVKNNISHRNIILDTLMFAVMLSLYFVKGSLHETLAYTLGIFTLIHFIWHWKQFKAMYCHLIPKLAYRYLVGTVTAILLAAVLTSPLYLTSDERPGHGGGYGGPPDRVYDERRH
jgi:hypothetical protein